MDLELQVDPDSAASLTRAKALATVRQGRSSTRIIRTVWYDCADHRLLYRGLIAAEHLDAWRLERLIPGEHTWLPAQPAPVVAQAESASALLSDTGFDPAVALAPLVAFEGRRTVSKLVLPEGPVTLTVDRGVLRAVTAEHPVARLALSGSEQAVLVAGRLIAAAVPAAVPRASLAAEAIALATGGLAAPRHLGTPRLPDAEMAAPDALAHILGHLTDVILHYAPFAGSAKHLTEPVREEAVHQMRVAVRRALSALSVFRSALPKGALDPVRDGLKALGKRLGHTRDWDVFVAETVPMVAGSMPPDERLDRMTAAAVRQRRTYRQQLTTYLESAEFRALGIDLAWSTATKTWRSSIEPAAEDSAQPRETDTEATPPEPSGNLRDFAPSVLRQRWRKLLSAGKRIEHLDIQALHAVRLHAKRARYAAEMFSVAYDSKAARRSIRHLTLLQTRLGVLNDGAVATELLSALGGPSGRHAYAVGVVTGFIASRAGKIRPRIVRAYDKFRRLPPYWG